MVDRVLSGACGIAGSRLGWVGSECLAGGVSAVLQGNGCCMY